MVWAPLLVLASAVNASTYDQAACAADAVEPAPIVVEESGGRCSEPAPVAAPAVIDCNDPGMSKWVGEMIGSCDMPKQTPGGPTVLRPAHETPAQTRLCDGFQCAHDSSPLRAIGRELFRPDPGLGSRFELEPPRGDSALADDTARAPRDPFPRRLERPPRA
jgi:hypothetical protein